MELTKGNSVKNIFYFNHNNHSVENYFQSHPLNVEDVKSDIT